MSEHQTYVDRFLNPLTREELCQEIDERIAAMRANPHKSETEHVSDVLELASINAALIAASCRLVLQRHLN